MSLKQQRKEMFAKLGAAQQLLSKANVPDKDHMETLVPFKVSFVITRVIPRVHRSMFLSILLRLFLYISRFYQRQFKI